MINEQDLSDREMQIVRLLLTGASNREISRALQLTEGTVKTYLGHVFRKTNAKNRTQLALWASDCGIAVEHIPFSSVAMIGAGAIALVSNAAS